MEQIVLDTNILAASFLEGDTLHQQAQPYLIGLETGDYTFHMPMLVVVEVVATVSRQVQPGRQALLARARKSLGDWERDGSIVLYPLDRDRMERAVRIAQQHRLKGADSVMAGLAEELGVSLRTFDKEILDRFAQASI